MFEIHDTIKVKEERHWDCIAQHQHTYSTTALSRAFLPTFDLPSGSDAVQAELTF